MAVKRTYTRDEVADLYSRLNNEGKGFAIGEEDQEVWDAISNAGYYFKANYGIGIYHVTKDGREYLVGGDGVGRNAWAVQI